VILFDNRGVGQSDAPNYPYTIDMMADDLIGLCDYLSIKKANFIGHSMGGYILQTLAYKCPDLVKCAVIANSAMKMNDLSAAHKKEILLAMENKADPKVIFKKTMEGMFTPEFAKKYETVFETMNMRSSHPMSIEAFRNQLNALIHFDSGSWIHQLQVPCLFIASDQDHTNSPEEVKRMAELVPHAEYVCIENAGHVPQMEQPQEFNRLIWEFLC
jgi:3-oxoadipate enol-lactonase